MAPPRVSFAFESAQSKFHPTPPLCYNFDPSQLSFSDAIHLYYNRLPLHPLLLWSIRFRRSFEYAPPPPGVLTSRSGCDRRGLIQRVAISGCCDVPASLRQRLRRHLSTLHGPPLILSAPPTTPPSSPVRNSTHDSPQSIIQTPHLVSTVAPPADDSKRDSTIPPALPTLSPHRRLLLSRFVDQFCNDIQPTSMPAPPTEPPFLPLPPDIAHPTHPPTPPKPDLAFLPTPSNNAFCTPDLCPYLSTATIPTPQFISVQPRHRPPIYCPTLPAIAIRPDPWIPPEISNPVAFPTIRKIAI